MNSGAQRRSVKNVLPIANLDIAVGLGCDPLEMQSGAWRTFRKVRT